MKNRLPEPLESLVKRAEADMHRQRLVIGGMTEINFLKTDLKRKKRVVRTTFLKGGDRT